MERPVDAVTVAVLRLQHAQREVNNLVREMIERVQADPVAASSHPDVRTRWSELRRAVDQAVDDLIAALARMGEHRQIERGE